MCVLKLVIVFIIMHVLIIMYSICLYWFSIVIMPFTNDCICWSHARSFSHMAVHDYKYPIRLTLCDMVRILVNLIHTLAA